MHLHEYAFAAGWDVPLNNLNNVEEHLGAYNFKVAGTRKPIGIRSIGVLDLFPVRSVLESGRVRGDGKASFGWEIVCYDTAYAQLATYFTDVSVKWTIYTRRMEFGTYARYNCWAVLPGATDGDLQYLGKNTVRAILRFTDLVASS